MDNNHRPIGAHMSIAGGVSKAPGRAHDVGANVIQVFTKNNTQWRAAPLSGKEIAAFHETARTFDIGVAASHTCYLINLASPDETILGKSRLAFIDEMDRADALSIPNLVFHPGSHTGAGEDEGLRRIVESLDWACEQRPSSKATLTIETTAGQGTGLGHSFEQVAHILDAVKNPGRYGVCVDTCHIFAGGYDISTKQGYADTMRQFDRLIGVNRIRLFHVNDSKTPLGSRVDRHEHIGKGKIGIDGFRFLLSDKRFFNTPMILETPKGEKGEEDKVNLSVLRGLMRA